MNAAIRYRGLASGSSGKHFPEFVENLVGYKLVQDGDDWVVPQNDPALSTGPKDVLRQDGRIRLLLATVSAAAKQLASAIPDTFDEGYRRPGPVYTFEFDEKSKVNEAYALLCELIISKPERVEQLLREKVLPFMMERMECQYVIPLVMDASYQQSLLSLAKFGWLLENHEPKRVEELTLDRSALIGILPNQVDLLGFVNALTRMAPLAITLPIERMDCAWHFTSSAMYSFPHIHTEGLFQQFSYDFSPISDVPDMLGLSGLRDMGSENILKFLQMVVVGVNRLNRYVADPRNFVRDDSGQIDHRMQLQAFGAVGLLFADIQGINSSSSAYSRMSFSMSALDKLANLKKFLGRKMRSEGLIFSELAAVSTGRLLKEMLRRNIVTLGDELESSLSQVVDNTYGAIHDHIRNDMSVGQDDERARLERLRQLRNLRHGTFLQRNSFDELFGESRGTVPKDIASLPILLAVGLILDPQRFLSFDPTM